MLTFYSQHAFNKKFSNEVEIFSLCVFACYAELRSQNSIMLFLGNLQFQVILDSVQSKRRKSTFGSATYWPRFTQKSVPYVCWKEKKLLMKQNSYITIANIYSIIFNGMYIIYNSSFTVWNMKFTPLLWAITMTYYSWNTQKACYIVHAT